MESDSDPGLSKAVALCDLGLKLERIPGRLSEAEKAYKSGLEAGPEVSFVLASYASFYIRKKLKEVVTNLEVRNEVEKCITKARNKTEEFEADYASEFLNVCAVFYSRVVENLEEAEQLFESSLELDPRNIDALYNYATVLDQLTGESERAAGLYKSVLELEPDHCMALNNYGAYLVDSAKSCSNEKRRAELFENAYNIFERANSLQPGLPAFNVACIAALKGDTKKARNWMLEAYLNGTIQGEHGSRLLAQEQDLSSLKHETWFKELVSLVTGSHPIEQPDYRLFFAENKVIVFQAELGGNEGWKGVAGTTGWTVWNSCFVILRYLEKILAKKELQLGKVLDLSGGLGLLGVACALQGAECCIVSEVGPAQLEAIRWNARQNLVESKVSVLEYAWGTPNAISKLGCLDLVLASDLLYIAVRENLEAELLSTLLSLVKAPGSPTILFAFEVRLPHKEDAFMKQLEKCMAVQLHSTADVDLTDSNATNEQREHAENLESIFYEPPDVRLYSLKELTIQS